MGNAATISEPTVYRFDVAPRDQDIQGRRVREQAAAIGYEFAEVRSSRIYFIESAASPDELEQLAADLLADGVAEQIISGKSQGATVDPVVEVHLKPGVMDPVAATVEQAMHRRGLGDVIIRTGRAFHFPAGTSRSVLEQVARRLLSSGVIEDVHFDHHVPSKLASATPREFELRSVGLSSLDEAGLKGLSRTGHLFLSLEEMQAIQTWYRERGREPTDVELETLAQTWSEHCVHKTLKSRVKVVNAAGKVVREYGNLIGDTIFASTMQLTDGGKDKSLCLSVFKDNAGVIAFDDTDGVCIKVETHNRPSAIEPYGGAATGIGGVIRDILGTGLGARPIASTDVFCVAHHDTPVPDGVIEPTRILEQIVAGVRDYGNRMGIPTVNGAVFYDDNYVANPLVFCGCVGLLPRDKVEKEVRPGDRIVVLGGRTGRDGIHGATFSSSELTDTHGSEFSHAVQIGNAITEKQVADVLLVARDRNLFSAVTDCGAGGLSSAIGEMGEKVGATVQLDKVPLKYAGLRYDEIWISEAQERMVLSVPAEHLDELLQLAASEDVEATDIGSFGTDNVELVLRFGETEVGRMTMAFLHDGIPMPTRTARLTEPVGDVENAAAATKSDLLAALADPNVASKHRVIRQYDHEVQAGTVVKPLVGPQQIGPADAAVIRPKLGSFRGVAVGCGLAPQIADTGRMAVASIDEAVRNVVCVGGDFKKLSLLDNFCWPGTDNEEAMGQLVLACEACRDVAIAFGCPFISGKDSLHNQFTDARTGRITRIPPTLLITAMAIVDDVRGCVTSDLKRGGDRLILVRPSAGNHADLAARATVHRFVADLIRGGTATAAHDVSDGGWLVAVAEMCIGGNLGATLDYGHQPFTEPMTHYVLAVAPGDVPEATDGVEIVELGTTTSEAALALPGKEIVSVDELRRTWRGESE